ncbi:hypothetical protein [Methylomicrobium lacus]|uniref:hypothetical protein n=1 Tax=Methylomicrobium lacus TaxID=136992 RepID=UPI0004AF2D50|nr:hypothetical protein [Methylomicrobium lacus]
MKKILLFYNDRQNLTWNFLILSLLAALLCIPSCTCLPMSEIFDPNNPCGSGYQLVFSDEFNSASTIDVKGTGDPKFKWYTTPFFVRPSSKKPSVIEVSNGVLTLNSTKNSARNSNIATAMPGNNKQGWLGKAFGAGAYFEARISFDPITVNTANGWPSFWSMAIEHMAQKGADQWIGRTPDYKHFIEDDFFEYNTASFAGPNSYSATIHDWFGIYNKTCSSGYCKINNHYDSESHFNNAIIKTPTKTDWTKFHTIGQLWVPSNPLNSMGYVQNYFDGKLMSTVSWIASKSGPPTTVGDYTFSIMDKSHLVVILGTGVNQPLNVDWVHVWQKTNAVELSFQQ